MNMIVQQSFFHRIKHARKKYRWIASKQYFYLEDP